MSMILRPACEFSIDALTCLYNRARKDYMVPMQMTPAGFRQYIRLYDVDLHRSAVADKHGAIHGIGLLGVRPGRAWITRLGVLPACRKAGAGLAIVRRLVDQADAMGVRRISLEIIEGNRGAERLFRKLGFRPVRRLLVLGRHHGETIEDPPPGKFEWMACADALERLENQTGSLPWKNQVQTYRNAGDEQGLRGVVPGKARGWLVFRKQPGCISHYLFRTLEGDPGIFARAALAHLHQRYPKVAAHVENIQADDPHLAALRRTGYEIRFRRIEMERT